MESSERFKRRVDNPKSLEMGDDESAASKKRYKTQMREEIQLIQTKELEKRCAIRAEALVDAAGGWIECENIRPH